jgi:non-canonical poly(A) RNA polymerase PAPD5/7
MIADREGHGDRTVSTDADLEDGGDNLLVDEDGYLPLNEPNEADDDVDGSDMEQSPSSDEYMNKDYHWDQSLPPPWLDEGMTRTSSIHPLTLLHNEIVSFVHLMEPLPSESEQRELLVQRIRHTVEDNFPDGTRVEVFGSQATGLFLPTSDIDLVIFSPNFKSDKTSAVNTNSQQSISQDIHRDTTSTNECEKMSTGKNQNQTEARSKGNIGEKVADSDSSRNEYDDNNDDDEDEEDYVFATKTSLHRFAQAIRKDWGVSELSYLEIVENTRIPLVKFTHASTNISVDVSFDQPSGPPAAQLMKRYLEALPPLRPLTFVLKYFLAARCLNEPYTGGVGSFLLQLMIVAFLQHRERDAVNFKRLGVYNLGSLLLEFLELYGIEFNYFTTGISVRYDGFFFPKGSADRRSTFWKPDRTSMVSFIKFTCGSI